MSYLKLMKNKKLAKAIAMSLVVGAGMVGMAGSASADDSKNYLYGTTTGDAPDGVNVFSGHVQASDEKDKSNMASAGISYEIVDGHWYNAQGGFSSSSNVTGNTVKISGGYVGGSFFSSVTGGFVDENFHASNNAVLINGGNIDCQEVVGGTGQNATLNKVIISNMDDGAAIVSVTGGLGQTIATKNVVTIEDTGNGIMANVLGGFGEGDTANFNIVNISGKAAIKQTARKNKDGEEYTPSDDDKKKTVAYKVTGAEMPANVAGGAALKTANFNIVNISGGSIDGDVYGGQITTSSSGVSTVGNKVNLIGKGGVLKDVIVDYNSDGVAQKANVSNKDNEISISGTVYGGSMSDISGNTLNAAGTEIGVENIANFETINFYLPNTTGDTSKDMLVINNHLSNDTDISSATIDLKAYSGTELNADDKINLIHKKDTGALTIKDGIEGEKIVTIATSGISAIAKTGTMSLEILDGDVKKNDLVFSVTGDAPDPEPTAEHLDNMKNMVETRASGMATVNESVDFMAEQAMSQAKLAVKAAGEGGGRDVAPFAAIGGGKMRYNSGSHVDSRSWHGAVGVAKEIGDLTLAIAVNHGKTSYDSYNDGGAHGTGDSKATGVNIMAEVKKENGIHYDASIRAGRIKNEYRANLSGFDTRYNESSTYYGLSLGGGKEFAVSDKDSVDVYGRYIWTHTNSSDATDNYGKHMSFDSINSHRLRIGSRYTHTVNDMSKLYAGLAWQYEFDGDARAVIAGTEAPSPSLKGHSGLLELGWKLQASKAFSMDLNVTGWAGKQRGVTAGVNMQFKF